MILIDETKLTNGTLMTILGELGYKTDYYRCWTEEEKETILAKERDKDKEYVKRILDNEKYVIDFETMFEEQLPKIQVLVGKYEGIPIKIVNEIRNNIE